MDSDTAGGFKESVSRKLSSICASVSSQRTGELTCTYRRCQTETKSRPSLDRRDSANMNETASPNLLKASPPSSGSLLTFFGEQLPRSGLSRGYDKWLDLVSLPFSSLCPAWWPYLIPRGETPRVTHKTKQPDFFTWQGSTRVFHPPDDADDKWKKDPIYLKKLLQGGQSLETSTKVVLGWLVNTEVDLP
ncbi:hypothetical protein THAOC_37706 [Thalassiosira oceanica]|uniref:Uncharacterized protein n=1 Tax=Thalassiosira oceanica TaxID=159749 RepID=K0R5I8_THAOC|nr:hypothetical protein THAOC_37706 [Thalassiosira oceanica]|eukprot:EJK43811.1 hypothetical protein THAOC_37706 [Thalassiosira oceanica]